MFSNTLHILGRRLAFMLLGTLLVAPLLANATGLSISQVPLFITIAMPPNVTVLLDDSGSMEWGHVPDDLGGFGAAEIYQVPSTSVTATCTGTVSRRGVCSTGNFNYSCSTSGYTLTGPTSGASSNPSTTGCVKPGTYKYITSAYIPDTFQYKSAAFNPLAYDPTISYTPGYSDTGTQLSTSFTKAYVNGYNTTLGFVDLSQSYMATIDYDPSTDVNAELGTTSSTTGITSSPNTFQCRNNFLCVRDEVNDCQSFNTNTSNSGCNSFANFSPTAAFYYKYTPTGATNVANGCGTHTYVDSTGKTQKLTTHDDSCYTKVVVSATSGPGGIDERQNFANWYSFYRTRNLTTNTSANIAFTGLNQGYRVAWRDLNTCTDFSGSNCQGWDGTTNFDNRIATFTGAHRTNFFDWLAQYPASGGTPLRAALQSIGEYYKTPAGVSSPYAFNPQVTDSPEYVCRPNYAVIMTDGIWNDTSAPSPDPGNADGTAGTLPDGTTFPAKTYPYYDNVSDTLADVAFYYWKTNLRPDLGTSTALQFMPYTKSVPITDNKNNTVNLLPYWNPQNDPASWPHMVTFTIGLGLTSTLITPSWGGSTYAGGYDNVVTGNIAWLPASSNSPNNSYDLWHTALDSRGQFFSADSPADVQAAFNSIVNRIQGRTGSSSAIAVNSTRLDSNTFIYQAQFNSSNWTGEVKAFSIGALGSVATNPTWLASAQTFTPSSRNILTWDETANSNTGGGTAFQWANLNSAEQTALNTSFEGVPDTNGSLRLNFLRGDQSDESDVSGGIFRIRANVLGDIVDSNPQFVGTENFGFDVLSEGGTYDAFVAAKTSRTEEHMLYVGANDGMLHAFDADHGTEIFAYVPRGVYSNLSALTDPLYTHEFYVDGSPTSVDAFVGGSWKTLLVGTTGAGGKDTFLLDVTNAASMTNSDVLWDYDGVDGTVSGTKYSSSGTGSAITLPDPDMGYTVNEPTIVRMHDGDWYALFGNGYNSTNQQAVIYLYNINTKTLYKYSTGIGSSTSPNGMSSPSPVDYNGDRITDAIYAGDLLGNLWKLDVSGSTPSSWKFTTYGNSVATPLFTGHDSSGNVQPITVRPQVGLNASGQVMIYFGTGTYFLTGDNTVNSNPPVMSFYGIIDDKGNAAADQVKGSSNTDRSELLQQFIVATTLNTTSGNTFRTNTAYTMTSSDRGWFFDLETPSTTTPTTWTAQGERAVSDAVLDLGRVVFTTLIPQGNACAFGGQSFLMEVDMNSGGNLPASPFDTNGNGVVNNADLMQVTYTDPATNQKVTKTVAVSGQQSNVGIIKTPGIITSGQLQYKYYSGSTGSIGMTTESGSSSSQRVSWQELQ